MRANHKTVFSLCLLFAACSEAPGVSAPPGYLPGVDTDGDGDTEESPGNQGSAGGPGDGDGDGDDGVDGDLCKPIVVKSDRLKPDMMIVLDRSGSMNENNRWGASVSALKAVTETLDSSISFGLMAFPGAVADPQQPPSSDPCAGLTGWQLLTCQLTGGVVNVGGWGGGATCETGTTVVPVGRDSAPAIAAALDGMAPSGSTPTAAALRAAHDELGSGLSGPDQAVTPKFVLLVTDGEPKCEGTDEQSVAASVAAVRELAEDGVKTYVVGYDTQSGTAKATMDMLAQAGGTGASEHISVENEASLVAALEDIAGRAISCTFVLDQAPPDPTFVGVEVDGSLKKYDDPNGWTLSDDGLQILIQGESCETLRSDGDHKLVVDIRCDIVVL